MKPQIIINDVMGKSDENFVINAWLKIAYNSKNFAGVKPKLYYKEMGDNVLRILSNPHTKFVFARNVEDESQLYGGIVYHSNVLHFAYVKGLFRGLGLFKEMYGQIPDAHRVFLDYYTLDNSYSKILKKYDLDYNPFELLGI